MLGDQFYSLELELSPDVVCRVGKGKEEGKEKRNKGRKKERQAIALVHYSDAELRIHDPRPD